MSHDVSAVAYDNDDGVEVSYRATGLFRRGEQKASAVDPSFSSGSSFDGDTAIVSTVIGVIVAASAIGWTLYRRVYSDKGE